MNRLRRGCLLAASAILWSAACGGAPVSSNLAARGERPRPPHADGDAGASTAADGMPSLEALAARGPTDAPLMHELLRAAQARPRSPDVVAERDLCVRATIAASRPVRVHLADGAGNERGEALSGEAGVVPPRGPACVKKGESLHLVVEGGDGVVRAVLFGAP